MLGLALAGGVSTPLLARAQMVVTDPTIVTKMTVQDIAKQVLKMTENAIVSSVGSSLLNLLVSTANQVAETAAIWVASGGPGESPLVVREEIGTYLKYAGAAVLMQTIETLDKQWGGLASNPRNMALLRQGLINASSGTALNADPDFDFEAMKSNYDAFLATVNSNKDLSSNERTTSVLAALSSSFDSNDFSQSMQAFGAAFINSQQTANINTQQLLANSGFLNQTDATSGYTTTPAALIRDQLQNSIRIAQETPLDIGKSAAASNPNLLTQLGGSMASVFTNTLMSELMKKFYGGMFEDVGSTFSDNPFDPDALSSSSRANAQALFRSIKTFRPVQVSDYSLITELASCPATSLNSIRPLFSCAMDSAFASAVNQSSAGGTLTVADAIEEGYLNGNWALIPSSDTARNQDPKCATYGFCAGNLVKLRKARIVPVGWELAADSQYNSASDPVTLQEAMDGFYDCNTDGQIDENHKWCHLIDPNWVLKAPQTTCRTYAYGQLLEMNGSSNRAQECVDIQSCISENDDGSCSGGYGYCVREQNTWKFGGDSCQSQFASCLSFSDRAGEAAHYLTSTVDRTGCNADSVGCLWYSSVKELQADGSYSFPTINDTAVAAAATDAYQNRIYLNAKAETCSDAAAGCSEVLARTSDLSLNILLNPGFENDLDDNSEPDAWLSSDWTALTYSVDQTQIRTGKSAVTTGSSELVQYGLTLNQSRFYNLSFYAKQGATGTGTATVTLDLADAFGVETVDLTGTSYTGDCTVSGNTVTVTGAPTSTSYERFECIFTAPTLLDKAARVNAVLSVVTGSAWIDDMQLEQGETPTSYHVAYSTTPRSSYVKLPPSYLGCTGGIDDPAACANYAQICSANDAGCLLYTPVNGDPDISAITSELDVCPASCVGYDTYKQEPTRYEPNGDFPLYFIASTADTCKSTAVGCDEFTNTTTEQNEYYTYLRACVTNAQAAANTSDDNMAVFYTWEGSDDTGYQLRTWYLLESNLDNTSYSYGGVAETNVGAAPCTTWTASASGIACSDDSGDFIVDRYTETCDEHDDIYSNPDCREFYDANGDLHYREWDYTVTVSDQCSTYRKTEIAGLGNDGDADGVDDGQANCEDAGGYFDTAISTCKFYGLSSESIECKESENGCRNYSGGQSNNSRKVFEELFEGGSLSDWDAGSATAVTLSNESVATDGHSIASDGNTIWTYFYQEACATEAGCLSSGAVLGGSCTVNNGENYCGTLTNYLYANKTYTLTFWAKGSGKLNIGFDTEASGTPSIDAVMENGVELTDEWQRYSVGPVDISSSKYPTFGDGSVIVFNPTTAGTFYIDNIVLREGEEDLTLIANSWSTPAVCDQNSLGNNSPQYHLGCSAYTSSEGDTVNLRSFSRLCSDSSVGCAGYYTTAQSTAIGSEIVNGTCSNPGGAVTTATNCYLFATGGTFDTSSPKLCSIMAGESSCLFDLSYSISEADLAGDARLSHISFGPETVVVPADTDLFAIIGDGDTCSSADAGCQELGEPTLSADRSIVTGWTSTYLVNDPDTYATSLCSGDAVMCEEYDAGSDGMYYFKDPGASVCEYKTNVLIGSKKYDGWFVTGTSDFCYGTGRCSDNGASCSLDSDCRTTARPDATCTKNIGSYLVGGEVSGIWQNGDSAYSGMVGTCTSAENGCSEFRDPLAVEDDEFYTSATGTSYYFVNNGRLEDDDLQGAQKCNGKVSQENGCVLFYDTGDPSKDYNTSATYISSVHADVLYGEEPYSLVKPIDCSGTSTITALDGTTVDLCAQRCAYKNLLLHDTSGQPLAKVGYSYGGSCLVDSDCQNYESDAGDIVSGSCETTVSGLVIGSDVPVTRLTNDTNTILQVDRDRSCSEWLTCSSSRTVWDEETSQYQTICDSIDLCTEYSNSGDASFCSKWDPDDPAIVLDTARYVDRNVSWYGEEYSGYAVPDIYPVQHLDQVDISPEKVCALKDGSYYTDIACESDTPCLAIGAASQYVCSSNINRDYRLGLAAGSCSGTAGYGDACQVGYCADSGSACTANTDCNTGNCIVGTCYAISTTLCTNDEDCTNGTCLSGECAVETGSCDLNYSCGAAGGTCIPSDISKVGTCYRDECVVTIQGAQFSGETAEESSCRAFPEADSPFPDRIVKTWLVANGTTETETVETAPTGENARFNATAYSTVSGFEQAKYCPPGEECECSYKKVSSALSQSAYLGVDTTMDSSYGVCSGGSLNGAICHESTDCLNDEDPDTTSASEGTCEKITREDTMVGLSGYCLERDSATNLYGDRAIGACLSWLPVDQLKGQTDLYGKDTEAGYDGGETAYCAYVAPYANVTASKASKTDSTVACLERNRSASYSDATLADEFESCVANNAAFDGCPPGFFLLVGDYWKSGEETTHYNYYCKGDSTEDNDCPFVCVPKNGYTTEGGLCENAVTGYTEFYEDSWELTDLSTIDGTTFDYSGDAYWYADPAAFDEAADAVQDCVALGQEAYLGWVQRYTYGYTLDADEEQTVDGDGGGATDATGFYNYSQAYELYPGCKAATVVDDGLGITAAAYTDRVMGPDGYTLEVADALTGSFGYIQTTTRARFGVSRTQTQIEADVDPMAPIIAACRNTSTFEITAPTSLGCASGTNPVIVEDFTNVDARSFVNFSLAEDKSFPWKSTWDTIGISETEYGVGGSSVSGVHDILSQLFANSISQFQFNDGIEDGSAGSVGDVASAAIEDSWDDREYGTPPTVMSVDTNNCYGLYCREGSENAITLNDQELGDQSAEDGFFRANVKFFAAAGKNQLPLRRVLVDWGDGTSGALDLTGSEEADNYYKNHRGLTDDSQTTTYCDTNEEWGMTSESCDPNYFNYTHNYRCSKSTLASLPLCEVSEIDGRVKNSPCKSTDESSCVYQPRVHVRDNWGWCSGSCSSTYGPLNTDDSEGCFDGYDSLALTADLSECNYDEYPTSSTDVTDPWVYYDGVITVKP